MSDKIEFNSLFTSTADSKSEACLNWTHDPLEVYTIAYKEAADILVNQIMEIGLFQNILVYPICFLYRQYIELRLKEIIRSGKELMDQNGCYPQDHNISNLFENVKEIIRNAFPDEKEPDLSLSQHVINEFSTLDPGSFAFRYPTDKSGINRLAGVPYINLSHLAGYINKFAAEMDGISTGIAVYLGFKREFQRY